MPDKIEQIARKLCCGGECRAEMENRLHPEKLIKSPCNAIMRIADVRTVLREIRTPEVEIVRALEIVHDNRFEPKSVLEFVPQAFAAVIDELLK